jgi:hypothetical protein
LRRTGAIARADSPDLKGIAAAEQFPVNPGELVEALQELLVGLDAVAGLLDLRLLFEQQGSHLPFGQAAAQIEEGAVFLAGSAVAIGAATLEKALQEGGAKGIGWEGQRAQEMGFALTQGKGREAFELCLTHSIGKIAQSERNASENENAG